MTAIQPHACPPANPTSLRQEELTRMYEEAMSHLTRARRSAPDQKKHCISTVVKILSRLKERHDKTAPPENDGTDLSALYAYMIDRLSISHSGLDIDPVNEVSWLIRNLRELSTARKYRRSAEA